MISYRRVRKERKATNSCIRLGHSLWSANQCKGLTAVHACTSVYVDFWNDSVSRIAIGLWQEGSHLNGWGERGEESSALIVPEGALPATRETSVRLGRRTKLYGVLFRELENPCPVPPHLARHIRSPSHGKHVRPFSRRFRFEKLVTRSLSTLIVRASRGTRHDGDRDESRSYLAVSRFENVSNIFGKQSSKLPRQREEVYLALNSWDSVFTEAFRVARRNIGLISTRAVISCVFRSSAWSTRGGRLDANPTWCKKMFALGNWATTRWAQGCALDRGARVLTTVYMYIYVYSREQRI